jgi:hypothetical protein
MYEGLALCYHNEKDKKNSCLQNKDHDNSTDANPGTCGQPHHLVGRIAVLSGPVQYSSAETINHTRIGFPK